MYNYAEKYNILMLFMAVFSEMQPIFLRPVGSKLSSSC